MGDVRSNRLHDSVLSGWRCMRMGMERIPGKPRSDVSGLVVGADLSCGYAFYILSEPILRIVTDTAMRTQELRTRRSKPMRWAADVRGLVIPCRGAQPMRYTFRRYIRRLRLGSA